MKAHVGTDRRGIVHTLVTTAANASDIGQMLRLLHGAEREVYGDQAYWSEAHRQAARCRGIRYRVNLPGNHGHKLSRSERASPHRFAPLSIGKLCDDGAAVQCPYHGLRFDGNGTCVHNPHSGGAIPKAAVVHAYPVVQRKSALWIWMGDPAKADPRLIPRSDFLDPETWAVGTGAMIINAHYELEIDNILDLSHIEFMHSLFASEAVRRGKIQSTVDGDTVWSKRFITEDDLPGFLKEAFSIPEGRLADWLDVRWDAPTQMALWSGAVISGRPRDEGVSVPSAHMFTPETLKSTHFFFAISVPKQSGPHAEAAAQELANVLRGPFEHEDKPMIEVVAERMGEADLWDLKPVLLSGDQAAVHARRILRKKIDNDARKRE
jgi:vanillate O-demethylase monooxygenase subunit